MDCNKCNCRPICSIYADVSKYAKYADININNCRYLCQIFSSNSIGTIDDNTMLFKESIDTRKKDYEKIKELSNRNALLKEKEQENLTNNVREFGDKIKVIAINNTDNSKTLLDTKCPSCGAMTFKEDLIPCSECGKIICSACGTIDNTDPKKILCDDCWLK